ncbi:hypothetical protein [Helicobacter burdigaliensis]|uniref:hypothetical protein n=1 Tax=Helicobacter burdigaliensis TaxID=2315334 RepID=UPI000EF6A973|nr:hypothetical protein [Helicobacter burdigaliensis]
MAMTPVGNVTYINQNAQVGSTQHANTQVKLDFAAMVNLEAMQEQQDGIQEVRPTEETLKTDEDAKGSKGEQEEQEHKKQEESQEEKDEIQTREDGTIAHLNISI